MKRSIAGLGLFLLMAMSWNLSAQEPTSEWYPLKVGNKWVYKVSGSDISMKVGAAEKIGDVLCQKIETIVNDKVVASEHVAVGTDGIYRHAINGQRPDKPVKFFSLPAKAGDSWEIDTKISGQAIKGKFSVKEEKAVKAGGKDYDTFVSEGKDFEIMGKPCAITYWFSKDVGIVKLKFTMDGQDTELVLDKYEAAK